MRYSKDKTLNFILCLIFFVFVYNGITYESSEIERLKRKSSNWPNNNNVKDADGPRIFCMIITYPNNFDSKLYPIERMWASQCDDYRFISSIPNNLSLEKYNFSHKILQPFGTFDDKYESLSEKMYLTFKYIYMKHMNYDWYLKADDDTFVIMKNLRKFLKKKDPNEPVTFGFNYKVLVEQGYHSGGAGYLLSHEALQRLGSKLSTNYTFCKNSGTEDVDVNACLRKLGVSMGKSIDDTGRERFHPLTFDEHWNGIFPDWFLSYAENKPLKGDDCCSDSSISFHYMNENDMLNLRTDNRSKRFFL